MNDLETLLRNEFDETAQSVPDSDEPWETFHRKLARRRAVLVGAAAAALLVAVAIVVPLSRNPAPVGGVGGVATRPNDGVPTFAPSPGIKITGGPYFIEESTGNTEGDWIAWAYTDRTDGHDRLCLSVAAKGQPANVANVASIGPDCFDPEERPGPVRTRLLPTRDPMQFAATMIVIANAGVHDLVVLDGKGVQADLKLVTKKTGYDVYAVFFPGPRSDEPVRDFEYSGIDAMGVRFSAIT